MIILHTLGPRWLDCLIIIQKLTLVNIFLCWITFQCSLLFIIIVHYQQWQYNLYRLVVHLVLVRVKSRSFSFFLLLFLSLTMNGRDSNRGPLGCRASVISTRPRRPPPRKIIVCK